MNTNQHSRLAVAALLLLIALAPLTAWGKDPAPAKDNKPAVLPKPYVEMADDLKLSDDQKTQLITAAEAKRKALAEWSTANQAQVTAAKSAVADAKKAGDKDALAKAQTALKQLEAGRTKIEQDAEKAMQDILTPAQRATAECCQMDSGFLHEFGKLTLTAEQQAKIKDICLGDSKSFEGLKPDDKDGRKALHAAAKKLIVDTVLTGEQKAALEKPKTAPKNAPQTAPKP